MEGAAKVAIFEGEVSGDEDLATVGRTEDGAVVTDAESYEFVASGGGRLANLLNQGEFSHRLGRHFVHAESRIRGGERWHFCGRNHAMQKREFGCIAVTCLLPSIKTLKRDCESEMTIGDFDLPFGLCKSAGFPSRGFFAVKFVGPGFLI